jgi:hypothetical protein
MNKDLVFYYNASRDESGDFMFVYVTWDDPEIGSKHIVAKKCKAIPVTGRGGP